MFPVIVLFSLSITFFVGFKKQFRENSLFILRKSWLKLKYFFLCFCSVATPWTATYQVSLSLTISQSLLKLILIESIMPSNNLILCGQILLSSIFPSIRVFSSDLTLHQVTKELELQLQHQSFQKYSGLISLRIDWFVFLAVQGTLRSPFQHHS